VTKWNLGWTLFINLGLHEARISILCNYRKQSWSSLKADWNILFLFPLSKVELTPSELLCIYPKTFILAGPKSPYRNSNKLFPYKYCSLPWTKKQKRSRILSASNTWGFDRAFLNNFPTEKLFTSHPISFNFNFQWNAVDFELLCLNNFHFFRKVQSHAKTEKLFFLFCSR
jgi:hypothetical protein